MYLSFNPSFSLYCLFFPHKAHANTSPNTTKTAKPPTTTTVSFSLLATISAVTYIHLEQSNHHRFKDVDYWIVGVGYCFEIWCVGWSRLLCELLSVKIDCWFYLFNCWTSWFYPSEFPQCLATYLGMSGYFKFYLCFLALGIIKTLGVGKGLCLSWRGICF